MLGQCVHLQLPGGRRQQSGQVENVATAAFIFPDLRGIGGHTQALGAPVAVLTLMIIVIGPCVATGEDGQHGRQQQRSAQVHGCDPTGRIHVRKSPFSWAAHSRANTSSQLRRNHFSTFFASVKRSGLPAGASGCTLRNASVLPVVIGSAVWKLVQLMVLPLRCSSWKYSVLSASA